MGRAPSQASPRRWAILAGYTLVAMSSQMVWLNFAAIASPQMEEIYNVGLDSIGLASALWPLIFIPLSIPSGLLVDRRGFRFAVLLGGGIIAGFSWLRLLAGRSFAELLVFQSLAGVGQPFVYNAISKLVGEWFPAGEQTVANGVGTMGQIAGMAVALVAVPAMVPNPSYVELRASLIFVSAVATASLVAFALSAGGRPTRSELVQAGLLAQMKGLLAERNVVVLMVLFLIGVGVFSALVQWVEAILYSRGVPPLYGGVAGGAMLACGMVGMVVVSAVADRHRNLKRLVLSNSALTALLLGLFSLRASYAFYLVVLGALGFFLLSLAPLGLQIMLESVGEARAGAAAGLVWLSSQVGALLFILALPLVEGSHVGLLAGDPWFLPVLSMALAFTAVFSLGFAIREPGRG